MSITSECPTVSDSWRGGVAKTARLLGVSQETIRRACLDGRLRFGVGRNGRKIFHGKEVKRFWRTY